jgi:hypothetical protein
MVPDVSAAVVLVAADGPAAVVTVGQGAADATAAGLVDGAVLAS